MTSGLEGVLVARDWCGHMLNAEALPELQARAVDEARASQDALAGLVSVVTPARDAAHVIEAAVRSVAEQTVPVLEHIVVDDGSTDGCDEVVRRLQARYPHVVYLQQSQQGSGPARNAGIEHARGRYIAFLDSDDWWLPNKLARQLAFMEANDVVFSYGDYVKRDIESGAILASYELPETVGYEDLVRACPIGCLTAAYNQEAIGKHYMPSFRRGQDWALWLALARAGYQARKYPGTEAVYNNRAGSLSARKILKGLDIYRIYRTEEGFGPLQALWYLGRHTASKLKT